jgi:cobalt-zinc-cadmium efflux system protein
MTSNRNLVAAATALNTAIFVGEAISGYQAQSLSLIMDSIHNLSDEMALVFLFLAYVLSQRISQNLVRTANVFNSVGLVAVSGLLLWYAVDRYFNPTPVQGGVAIVVGLLAAGANYGVARLLLKPSRNNAAIRLAYIHNLGDVWVSLAPVVAGVLVSLTGYNVFDPLVAGAIALWIIGTTLMEVVGSHEELIWPERIDSGNGNEEKTTGAATTAKTTTTRE